MYNEQTGEILHPLLIEREEKNVLVVVIAGDKGFAGGFNSNVGKARRSSFRARAAKGQNIDLEPVGKKAIGMYKRGFRRRSTRRRKSITTMIFPCTTIRFGIAEAQIEVAAEHRGFAG